MQLLRAGAPVGLAEEANEWPVPNTFVPRFLRELVLEILYMYIYIYMSYEYQ